MLPLNKQVREEKYSILHLAWRLAPTIRFSTEFCFRSYLVGFRVLRIANAATTTITITTTTIPAISVELVPPDEEVVELADVVELLEEVGGIEELEVELELVLEDSAEVEELELVLELDVDELVVLVLVPTGWRLARSVWFTQSPSYR